MRIFIIGAGRIGRAMKYLLKGEDVVMWDVDPSTYEGEVDCAVEMGRADLMLLCAPTSAHPQLAAEIRQYGKPHSYVISLAKGLSEEGETVPEILADALGTKCVGIMYGPMMAEEITAGKPSFAVVASRNRKLGYDMRELFAGTRLTVDISDDVHGVAWLGVLKNVYATLMGVMEELDLGCNMRGFMMTEIARESTELLHMLGGRRDTWFGAAGIGDLVCTVSSPHSRNVKFGSSLVNGEKSEKGEGAIAIEFLKERLGVRFEEFRLLVALDEVMMHPEACDDVFEHLMV